MLNALMAIPNLIALLALSPVVVQLTRAGMSRAPARLIRSARLPDAFAARVGAGFERRRRAPHGHAVQARFLAAP